MKKTDKKFLVILLILSMLFAIVCPAVVNAVTIEVDPKLENTGVTAISLKNRVLLSDGTLWKVESAANANLEDTGVKAISYVYSRYSSSKYDFYSKLKNDNTLYVKLTDADNESSVKDEKAITNVKKIIEQYSGDFLAYLTYTNELFFLDPYECTGTIKFNKVATDVEKVMGQYFIKDGKTYLVDGSKVLDQEIDKAYNFFCSVGNTLYEGVYYGEDSHRFTKYATDFVDFVCTNNTNGWMVYKSTDGTIKDTGNLSSTQQFYKYHAVDGSMYYYLDTANRVFMQKKNNVITLLKNVVDMNKIDDKTIVFVRSDGTVWANTPWSSTSCTKIISPSVTKLADVKTNEWYFNAIKFVVLNNIIKGYNATSFGPNDKLTRGQLVTILYRMEGEPEVTGTPKFSDVKDSSQYYYKPVKWATDNKIVSGYDNGKFGAEDNITREQLAVILYKYAKYKGKDVSATNNLSTFKDTNKISSWALSQVKWAVGAGVITGNADKTLNPGGNATRAEVAAMMQKYCNKVGR